ncbi:hypothetical protein B0H63DRAFT_267374 [Podospora didyma]|uniref:Uncharacterized protein n=1 Tax=Podospora didyma TaxID=330526 RepID=A0AAE0N9J3_9PEZI|nr:hypothetical protein B0H63DRAFT_267374 [Podospora didyma]
MSGWPNMQLGATCRCTCDPPLCLAANDRVLHLGKWPLKVGRDSNKPSPRPFSGKKRDGSQGMVLNGSGQAVKVQSVDKILLLHHRVCGFPNLASRVSSLESDSNPSGRPNWRSMVGSVPTPQSDRGSTHFRGHWLRRRVFSPMTLSNAKPEFFSHVCAVLFWIEPHCIALHCLDDIVRNGLSSGMAGEFGEYLKFKRPTCLLDRPQGARRGFKYFGLRTPFHSAILHDELAVGIGWHGGGLL